MRKGWQRIKKNRAVSSMIALAGILIISGWLWALVALKGIEPSIILHWVTEEKVSRITQFVPTEDIPLHLSVIGASGLLMVLVNGWLALLFEERHWFWGKFLAGATLLLGALIFIGFVAIISVN